MPEPPIKKDFQLARCCSPRPRDPIIGYFSHDNVIKVHHSQCDIVRNLEQERLVSVTWEQVIDNRESFTPGEDYCSLDEVDFDILAHHARYGIDYAQVVARKLDISQQEAFDRHRTLRELGLLSRVEPRIVQYRKGITRNKWIKHRNHTYLELTPKGEAYLKFHADSPGPQ